MYAVREEVSGGSEGADQKTNREKLPAGAGSNLLKTLASPEQLAQFQAQL
ncbi:TSC22 domain family protein 1 [Apodemus speciosus]|uniref:TSC22 domain family protein 1 n=1 Tax=Apodemus speciosus TaxID=105296 RepID=A0ABQ0F6W4_APOSI